MSTDRELLVFAARALNRELVWEFSKFSGCEWCRFVSCAEQWNPLKDDGDALRLAIALRLDVCIRDGYTDAVIRRVENGVERSKTGFTEPHRNDIATATRRAVVRASAYIGEWL